MIQCQVSHLHSHRTLKQGATLGQPVASLHTLSAQELIREMKVISGMARRSLSHFSFRKNDSSFRILDTQPLWVGMSCLQKNNWQLARKTWHGPWVSSMSPWGGSGRQRLSVSFGRRLSVSRCLMAPPCKLALLGQVLLESELAKKGLGLGNIEPGKTSDIICLACSLFHTPVCALWITQLNLSVFVAILPLAKQEKSHECLSIFRILVKLFLGKLTMSFTNDLDNMLDTKGGRLLGSRLLQINNSCFVRFPLPNTLSRRRCHLDSVTKARIVSLNCRWTWSKTHKDQG